VSHIGLLVLVAGAPLAIGCVHPPAILAAGAVAAVAFAAMLWRRATTDRQVRVPALGWVLLGVVAFTALQCVPLPAGVLKAIDPAAHRLFTDTLGDLGLYGPGSWRPLSLDPPATLWETLKIAIITATFLLAANLEEHHDRRTLLLLALGGAGVVMVFVGIVQVTAGTSKIYGLFQPWSTGRPSGVVFTTFVNANHGAAFLGLAAAAWVGLAAGTDDLAKRTLCVIGAVMCAAGIFLAVSRGGITAFAFAQLALVGLLLALRSPRGHADDEKRRRTLRDRLRPLLRLWLPLVLAAGVGVGLWLAYEPVAAKFATIDAEKEREAGRPKVWADALPMLRDHAWVGAGRGAFAPAYPRYQKGEGWTTYSHLENEYLQLPVDLGIPVGGGLLVCIALAAFGWLRRCNRGAHHAAALAALGGLAVHAFTDFNLETLGVALGAAALAGMLAAATPAGPLSEGRVPRRASQWTLAPLPLAILVFGALGLTGLGTWAERDAEALGRARRDPVDAFVKRAEVAVKRHPADYLQYAIAGAHLADRRDARALRWLNRAMVLHPRHPGPHVVAARALRAAGHTDQALVEYRAALERRTTQPVVPELVGYYSEVPDLLRALPDQAERYHDLVAALVQVKRPADALLVAQAGQRRWPQDPALLRDLAGLALTRQDAAAAEQWARKLLAADGKPASWVLVGSTLGAPGRELDRLAVYQEAIRKHPADVEILAGLAGALASLKRFDEARREAEKIQNAPTVTPAALARMHDQLAAIDEADGRVHRAQWHRGQAGRLRSGQ
jgi:O-antigen ligase/tetratricopeptide (TPR) repeat protein